MSTIQKIKPGKITIDKLGEMINNGFKESRRELLEVKTELIRRMDSQFGQVDSRFDSIEDQISKIRLNYATTDEHNRLDERVRKVERRVLINN